MHSTNHYFHLIGTITGDDLTNRVIAASFPFTIHKEFNYINFAQTIISL
jgi:hypothetical protein